MPRPFKRQPLPPRAYLWQSVSLAQLQRVKNWHARHRANHPVEARIWETVMTVWVMAWIGWLPAYTFDAPWAYPLCVLGVLMPRLYIQLRLRAHSAGLLRCDWLHQLV